MPGKDPALFDLVLADTRELVKSDPQAVNGLMVVAMDNLLMSLGIYTEAQIAVSYNKLIDERVQTIATRNTAILQEKGYTAERYTVEKAQAAAAMQAMAGSTPPEGATDGDPAPAGPT